jgi:hypothetical protein
MDIWHFIGYWYPTYFRIWISDIFSDIATLLIFWICKTLLGWAWSTPYLYNNRKIFNNLFITQISYNKFIHITDWLLLEVPVFLISLEIHCRRKGWYYRDLLRYQEIALWCNRWTDIFLRKKNNHYRDPALVRKYCDILRRKKCWKKLKLFLLANLP